jgi:NitT/TauT family transport system substrate-binding protein
MELMVFSDHYLLKTLNIKRACLYLSLFLISLMPISACSTAASAPDLVPVTVQLSWTHQAEFAGFYAAEQQGYFRDAGLKVTFLEGGPEVDFIKPVVGGRAQFGVAQPADLILARAAGKPVRSIAVIFRRSPIVFFSLQESGIVRPRDFVGRKIRTTVTVDQVLRAMMAKEGISQDQYERVYLSSDVRQFASGEVPVWGGFVNVFLLEVQKAGYKVNIVSPDDYGVHFYGDTLITTDSLIQENPDLVQRFMHATLLGWAYALENPEVMGTYISKYAPNANPDLEAAKMIASIPLINTGEDPIGWMKRDGWDAMARTLRAQGDLEQPLKIDDVYTMQFLEEMYGK